MKVKVLNRSMDDHLPATSQSPAPIARNMDPALHPFSRAREYERAVVATKLDRMFARPFVDALECPGDGVYAMAKDDFGALARIASASADGEVRVWDLAGRSSVWHNSRAHQGMVHGVAFSHFGGSSSSSNDEGRQARGKKRKRPADKKGKAVARGGYGNEEDEDDEDGESDEESPVARGSSRLLSCGVDRTVKLWDVRGDNAAGPLRTFNGKSAFHAISHHRWQPVFATASDTVDVWDETRTAPLASLKFNASATTSSGEHATSVTFNKSESSVLAAGSSDRTITLYDMRTQKALNRVYMNMRTNAVAFNPMQPPVLLAAGEDHQLYTYDMRNLKTTTQVFKGHVGAVMCCDWAPSGREFVSGSYDRTLRLWTAGQGKARDTYHGKRMQRVFAAAYTLDNRFVLSGSDDGNVRIWKARASDKLGVMDRRELARREYRDSLRDKWRDVADVKRIARQRHLPKDIHTAEKLRHTMLESRARKEENRRLHQPREQRDKKPKAERVRSIVRTED